MMGKYWQILPGKKKKNRLFFTNWVGGIYLYYHPGHFLILTEFSVIRIVFFPTNFNKHLWETLYSQDRQCYLFREVK